MSNRDGLIYALIAYAIGGMFGFGLALISGASWKAGAGPTMIIGTLLLAFTVTRLAQTQK